VNKAVFVAAGILILTIAAAWIGLRPSAKFPGALMSPFIV